MNFSTEIKDSTLREASCTNHVHYLEVGNYMPILHPTANTSLPGTDARMNKIFIAAYDYAEGDVYSIFGQELSLVNRDLKIYTGDYVKATIDFSDNSIKLVNISRVTYTPNTELGDIDYTYDVVIGSSRVTIHEQKIYLTENTDISINTTAYANMPAGTLYLELYNGSTLLNTSAYSANIAKRYVLQNAFSMPDMGIDTHLDIKVKLYFIKENPDDPDCVLENRAAAVSVTGKNIEWDYPVWTPVALDEIGYYYQVEANDSVTLMYPYSKNNRHKIGVLPAIVDNKPVKIINQLLLFNMENFDSQDNVDILADIADNNGILIDGGAFYNTKIGMIIPNDKPIDVREFAFANSEVRNQTFTESAILNYPDATHILIEYPVWFVMNPPYVLEINDTNWLNTKIPSYCFENCDNLGMIAFLTDNCVSVEEGAFANDNIHYLYFDDDSVVRVEPDAFSGATIRHLKIDGDYPNISLQKLRLDNSTIFENFRLPRIDDCVLHNVRGSIEYIQDRFYHYDEDAFGHRTHNYYEDAAYWACNIKALKIEGSWYNADYDKMTNAESGDLIRPWVVPAMSKQERVDFYDDVYIGKTIDTLSLNNTYCSNFSIEPRNQSVEIDYNLYDQNDNIIVGPDDSYNKGFFKMVDDCYFDQQPIQPLQIDKLDIIGYNATPRIRLNVMMTTTKSGSNTYYHYDDTHIELLNKPVPLDFRHVEFSENADLSSLCNTAAYSEGYLYDLYNGTRSQLNDVFSTLRILLPKYCEYIPLHCCSPKPAVNSSNDNKWRYSAAYLYQIGGTIMDIPVTKTIRSYTFDNMGAFEYDVNGRCDKFIPCKKMEGYAFWYRNGVSYAYNAADEWSIAMIAYGCTEISQYAIYGYPNITTILIPPTVTSLANQAFRVGYSSYGTQTRTIALPDTLNGSGFYMYGLYNTSWNVVYYDATYQSYFTFSDSGDTSTITGFDTPTTNNLYYYIGTYVVPEKHGDKPVVAMNAVFNGKDGSGSTAKYYRLYEIVVDAKIGTIVANTFKNVKTLRRVILPDTVTVIGDYAFQNCVRLNYLEFNCENFTSIGQYAFAEVGHSYPFCTYDSNVVPNSSSNYNWKRYDAYTKFILPLCRVNNNRFETDDWYMQDMSIKPFKFSNSITAIGAHAFHNSIVPTGAVYLPENSSYTIIQDYTFYGAPYITSMYIPDTITTIKAHSLEKMYGCEYLRIPNTATLQSTLEGCESLKAISYVFTSFLANQFKDCHSLVQFMDKGIADMEVNGKLQSSIATIPNYCFYNCEMITDYIWLWDNGREISDPTPITIGDYAFYGCKSLTHLDARKAVTSVGQYAFQNSSVDGDAFIFLYHNRYNWEKPDPNSSYTFRAYPTANTGVFAGDENLRVIDIPLGHYEYDNSNNRTAVTENYMFPTAVGMYEGCTNLTTITSHPYNDEVPEFGASTLEFPSTIPERCFKETNLDSATVTLILSFTTTVSAGAFRGNSNITRLEIPSSITSIGDYAFADCPNLEEVVFSNPALVLGEGVFSGCTSLDTISIASGYNFKFINLPDKCFEYCSLANCESLFEDLESAGERCFAGNKMAHMVIPIAEYGTQCFIDGESEDITFISGQTDTLVLGNGCFMSNVNLSELNFPSGCKLGLYGGVFEFDNALNLAPHELYNQFEKVIFLGVYKPFNNNNAYFSSPFSTTFGAGNTYPTYEAVTVSTEFEIGYTTSYITAEGSTYKSSITNDLMSAFNIREYTNITFEKCIPPGTFFAGSTYTSQLTGDLLNRVNANGGVSSVPIGSLTSITLGPNFKKVCDYASNGLSVGAGALSIANNTTGPWTIGHNAFYDLEKLSSIDINNCTSIGNYAFYEVANLTTVSNTSALKYIGKRGFYQCTNLKTFDFYGVEKMDTEAFYGSGVIINVDNQFRNTVKYIGDSAFLSCSTVTEVHLEACTSLNYLGKNSFGATTVTKIYFPNTTIGLFHYPNNNNYSYNSWQNAPKYAALGYQAFYSVRFNANVVTDGVYTVDSNCTTFYGGYQFGTLPSSGNGVINTLIVPDTVTDLCATTPYTLADNNYGSILYNSSSVTTLRITGNRTALYSSRFDSEGYTYNSNTGLFRYSRITDLTLTDSITKIPNYCFYNINTLVNFNIPEACTEIGEYAFNGAKPTGSVVYLSQRTMLVKRYAFTNITSIYLSRDCVLESNAIPNNCTKYYYEDMADLTDPKIPGNTPVN